ncbi:MAG: DUF58 domain-containing protein [Candidatus Edwardsbacteria bacterium]
MDSYRRFLKPEIVARLSGIDIKARLVVEGFLAGLHRSPYHGFSVEFAEYRQYMPGDEVRRIDWKVYGRTDRYYVKEFEEETNLKAYILLDASGSMGYHSNGISKTEYASYLAASLIYLLIKQQDAAGLLVFDEKIRTFVPPRSIKIHLNTLLRELDLIKPGGETNLSVVFHELAERIKRRGLIIVISDLFDEPQKILLGLKHFRHKKHEVIVFHLLDEAETKFPFTEEVTFRDMETGEELTVQGAEIRDEYQKKLQERMKYYKSECREHLIDYFPLTTSTPFDKALLAYLGKRSRIG